MAEQSAVTIDVELLDQHNPEIWDSIVADSKQGTVFHSVDWLELSLSSVNLSFPNSALHLNQRMFVLTAEGEPVGAFAGLEYSFLGLKVLVSPSPRTFTPYGGLVVRERRQNLYSLLMKSLLKEYPIIMSTDPPITPATELPQQYIMKYTFVLDLTMPVDILWSRIRKGTRRHVKKAENDGVSVLEASDENHIRSYHDLLRETHERKDISGLLPLSFYVDVFRKLGGNRVKLLLAVYKDDPVAGAFLLYDSKRFYYWSGASTETGLSLGANSMIQWKAILWGKDRGLLEYDMVGANIPSVAFFKAAFGGELRRYHRSIAARSTLLASTISRCLRTFGF